jgi:hypothetical protein
VKLVRGEGMLTYTVKEFSQVSQGCEVENLRIVKVKCEGEM